MKIVIHAHGGGVGHAGRLLQLLDRGGGDLSDGAEKAHQLFGALLTDAVDLFERRAQDTLSLLAVEADGIAVNLVLDIRHEGEYRAVGADGDLARIADDRAGAMVVVLDHAEHGDGQARGFYHGQHRADLAFTAV